MKKMKTCYEPLEHQNPRIQQATQYNTIGGLPLLSTITNADVSEGCESKYFTRSTSEQQTLSNRIGVKGPRRGIQMAHAQMIELSSVWNAPPSKPASSF
jgi:hypothetical protein